MFDKEKPERLFYRIKEVCDITGLKPHVLRYWEQEFKNIRPAKSPKGHRLYRRSDLETILTIKKLLYEDRFTIDGAKKYLAQRKNLLDEIRRDLEEILMILKGKNED
ncbi:MAG: MerR family transcriptional regulator [Desulfobacterota bacterium]|nr:MerR family transcriptional regulator [Thermodesulfobacteriota bacterium]MDW8001998.1 MerR family transcriptional regulator [Deltaproteobacteria bacterium]